MDNARWTYIKNLAPSEPRFIHISCEAYMMWDSKGVPQPCIESGDTYHNPTKNQRRKTVRALGSRQYKKLSKALRRPLESNAVVFEDDHIDKIINQIEARIEGDVL